MNALRLACVLTGSAQQVVEQRFVMEYFAYAITNNEAK